MKGKILAGSLAGVTALGAVVGAGAYTTMNGDVEAETSSKSASEESRENNHNNADSSENNTGTDRIIADEAVSIAEEETGGKAVELELDMEDQKYDVELEGDQEYEVEVHAFSGSVTEKETDDDGDDEKPLVQDGDSVSLEDIVASGMGELSGELEEWELDREDDGYDLSIETNEQEGDFFIHDGDGTVAHREIDDDDNDDDDDDDNDDD